MQWGPWNRSNGGESVRPPWPAHGEAVTSALAEPEAVEALEFVTGLMCTHDAAIPVDVQREMAQTLQVSAFFAGKVGIAQTTSEGGILRAREETGFNGHRVVTPRSPRTKYARHHQGNCPNVAAGKTQWPKECWDLMYFLDSVWCQREIGLQGGAMPGLKSIYDDPDYYSEFPDIARESLKVSAEENECLPGLFPNFEEWRHEVEAIAMDMFLCQVPVDEAVAEMDSVANMILARGM